MLSLIKRYALSNSNIATFFRFAGVGLTISLIDIAILYLLLEIEFMNNLISRVFSLTSSMLLGYFLNRYFTFHHIEKGRALWNSIIRHFSVHAIGGILNILIFLLSIRILDKFQTNYGFEIYIPFISVWVGGIAGLIFNFFFSRKVVFDN